MQLAFFFDQTRCSGCLTCVIACRQWHSIDHDAVNWRRVEIIEKGTFPNLRVAFISFSCFHCGASPCVSSCPTGAVFKQERDGIVLINPEMCLGESSCGKCGKSCPYHIPQYNPDRDFKMEKCNFCHDRLSQGKRPICVDACPMSALDSGPVDELLKKYGNSQEMEGFTFFPDARPSLVLKGKK